jgi:polyphosphate kinase
MRFAEFYMVRVAGLKGQAQAGLNSLSPDGLTPPQQLVGIHRRAGKLVRDQQAVWGRLRNELREASVDVVTIDALDDRERAWLKEHFENNIFPQLTPMSIDPAHPFPFLANKGFGIALQLFREFDTRHIEGLLLFPQFMPRFIRLPNFGNKTLGALQQVALEADDAPRINDDVHRGYLSSRKEDVPRSNLEEDENEPQRQPVRFVLLEHVVLQHTNDLFPGFVVQKHGTYSSPVCVGEYAQQDLSVDCRHVPCSA